MATKIDIHNKATELAIELQETIGTSPQSFDTIVECLEKMATFTKKRFIEDSCLLMDYSLHNLYKVPFDGVTGNFDEDDIEVFDVEEYIEFFREAIGK